MRGVQTSTSLCPRRESGTSLEEERERAAARLHRTKKRGQGRGDTLGAVRHKVVLQTGTNPASLTHCEKEEKKPHQTAVVNFVAKVTALPLPLAGGVYEHAPGRGETGVRADTCMCHTSSTDATLLPIGPVRRTLRVVSGPEGRGGERGGRPGFPSRSSSPWVQNDEETRTIEQQWQNKTVVTAEQIFRLKKLQSNEVIAPCSFPSNEARPTTPQNPCPTRSYREPPWEETPCGVRRCTRSWITLAKCRAVSPASSYCCC